MRQRFLKLYRWDGTEDQQGYWKAWTTLTGRTDSTQHEKEGAPWIREAWECSLDLRTLIQQRQARWMRKVHDGPWVQLGTVQNRLRALALLDNAFLFDVLPEASHGPRFWQATKNSRLRRRRAVLKTRDRAHEALRQVVDSPLHEYWLALVDAQHDQRKRGILRFGGFDPNGGDEEYEDLIAKVSLVSRELNNLTKQLEQFEDPILSEKEDRGRKDKGALATAILGLEKFFLDCGVSSRRQALGYTHALLYVAGLWPDEKRSGLQAKAADLRKRPSNSTHEG